MIDFKKLERYKEELTFASDRRGIEKWEQAIRGAIVRSEVAKMDGIKELISKLKEKIVKCNHVLQNDRKLSTEDRDKLFIRKDEQQWFIDFFEGANKTIIKAEDDIKKL